MSEFTGVDRDLTIVFANVPWTAMAIIQRTNCFVGLLALRFLLRWFDFRGILLGR